MDKTHAQKHIFYQKKSINISRLIYQYFESKPDPKIAAQKVQFGTSGHRGSSICHTFNERHVLAITQAIVKLRKKYNIDGPCYIGKDTHALSEVALISVIEVLSANRINVIIEKIDGHTATPIIAYSILNYNKKFYAKNLKADGIVVTSSHNPPGDGGIKYYSCYGGSADINLTEDIERYSNTLLLNNLRNIHRITLSQAWRSGYIHTLDLTTSYITELTQIVNIESIKRSGLKLCVDLMGGAGIRCWQRIAEFYKLDVIFIHDIIDPTFRFIHLDSNGIFNIDCTAKTLTKNNILIKAHNPFDLILSNDPDCDRYGISTPKGFVKSNDYLIIAIGYLFQNRLNWSKKLGVGKTIVSSTMIDKIIKKLNLYLIETSVGFKWFVKYMFYNVLGFAGEESAGGIFLDFKACTWSTDKDGIIMCLLAAEITAVSGKNLQEFYNELIYDIDVSSYNFTQISMDDYPDYKIFFDFFISKQMALNELTGDPIIKKIKIIGNKRSTKINGIKLITKYGWVAFRYSGTEKVYKIYSESFLGSSHRKKIEHEIYKHLSHISNEI